MNPQKLELLKKLQALAASDPESEEAKTAATMAAQIMEKYGLCTADLEIDGRLSADNITEFWEKSYSDDMIKWEGMLLSSVSTAFDCRCIRLIPSKGSGETTTLSLMGARTDVEIASWFFSSLHRRIGKMTEKHSRSKVRNQDFGMGIVTAVNQRLFEMRQEQNRVRQSSGEEGERITALVLRKKNDVDEEFEQRYPGAKADGRRKNRPTDRASFLEGILAGNKMSLSTPINQGQNSTLQISQ